VTRDPLLLGSGLVFLFCVLLTAAVFYAAPWSLFFWLSSGVLGLLAILAATAFGYVYAMDEWC